LSECQRLKILGCTAFGIELVGMGRDVTEQVPRIRCKARETLGGFDCAFAKAARFVEPTKQQAGTA
jgi:hypothetical protein